MHAIVFFAFDKRQSCVNKSNMRKRLRKIPQCVASFRIDFFREQTKIARVLQALSESIVHLFQSASSAREELGDPEAAHRECPFANVAPLFIAVQQARTRSEPFFHPL